MRRGIVAVVMIMCCFQTPFLYAEEPISDIQNLIHRVEASIALVDRSTSEEIAVAAYQVLNNFLFDRGSRKPLEGGKKGIIIVAFPR